MEFTPTDPSNSNSEAGLQALDLQCLDVGLGHWVYCIVLYSVLYLHEALFRSKPVLNVQSLGSDSACRFVLALYCA